MEVRFLQLHHLTITQVMLREQTNLKCAGNPSQNNKASQMGSKNSKCHNRAVGANRQTVKSSKSCEFQLYNIDFINCHLKILDYFLQPCIRTFKLECCLHACLGLMKIDNTLLERFTCWEIKINRYDMPWDQPFCLPFF